VSEFAGVPMSRGCKLGENNEEERPKPPPEPAPPPEKPQPPPPEKVEKEQSIVEAIWIAIPRFFGGEVGGMGGEVLSNPDTVVKAGSAVGELKLRDDWSEGKVSDEDYFNKMHGAKLGDIADYLKAKKDGNKGCVDELACSNSCSGLGQSLATSRACTGNLLNDLAAALGRAPKGQVVKHPEWVSKWNPDQGQIPETDFCLSGGGSTGPNRVSTACTLVLCPDRLATTSPSGECCGTGFGSLSFSLMRSSCLSGRCVDGVPSVDASGKCSRGTADPQPIGLPIPSGPRPERAASPRPMR
jgi:hypothetical protein